MYLRTTRRRNSDGSVVTYHQLAENVWDSSRRCAVAKVIYNLGRADEMDHDKLRRLVASVQRLIATDGPPTAAERTLPLPLDGTATTGSRRSTVGPDDVTPRDSWTYGGAYVLDALWKEIGIDAVLRDCARGEKTAQPFERALLAMVANRALEPYSKLYCWEQWLHEDVFLDGTRDLKLHHLYRAMDFLERHKVEVEKAVYFRMADLMSADVDLIFYDTTSLHFEVDDEDDEDLQHEGRDYEPLRKRGFSKNGREDAPQIVVGLAVTREGLPVRSWVFVGNTADVSTVEQVKQDLRGWRLGRCLFVGDAGMNSEENRRTLALGGGKYILGSRMRAGDEVSTQVLGRQGRYHVVREGLRVKEVVVGDGERRRRYVVCHNPAEEKRQRAHREELLADIEEALASLHAPEDGTHSKRMCELLTSSRYGRYLRRTSTGKLRIDRAAVEEAARYDGKWVITSNDDTLTPEDLALGYKQLMRVEDCWRQLKSGLRMRPVRHFRPWRIQAHVTIAVLSLLLERIVELRGGDTWRNIAARLRTIKVSEYDLPEARIQKTTALRKDVAALLTQLGVAPPPKVHSIVPLPVAQ